MNAKALKQAQQAVRQAQQVERGTGPDAEANYYWNRAERHYEEAGVDPEWFDHGSLMESLDEHPALMETVWIFPTDHVELTYEPDPHEATGIVAPIEDVYAVDP